MRLGKPLELEDISQVLAKGACPICAFLKNDQAALVRGGLPPGQVTGLCNFHAWALAAVVDRNNVAQIYLNVLARAGAGKRATRNEPCSFCSRLLQQEVIHIKELIEQMNGELVLGWITKHGTFCFAHADHLRQLAPARFHPVIDEVMERSATALRSDLENLLRREESGKGTGGGILGRVAEFLASQRGINR